MQNYKFTGMETKGLEFFGSIPLDYAIQLSDKSLTLQQTSNTKEPQAIVSIVAFVIENLKVKYLPWIKFTYPEVLFSLEICVDAKPARLAIKAYTSAYMYFALSQVDKYNTSLAKFTFEPQEKSGQFSLKHQKSLFKINYQKRETIEKEAPFQRLFTQKKVGEIYEIPWNNDVPQTVHKISYTIENLSLVQTIFGNKITLWPQAYLYLNRPHGCSPAIASSI